MDQTGEKLPADFWTSPRIVAALAEGDVATILTEVQRAKNWTQTDISRVLGYSQSWVSKVLRRTQSLFIDQIRDIVNRLGVPLHLLRVRCPGDDDPTKRREFGKALAFAPLILGNGGTPSRVAAGPMTTAAREFDDRLRATLI
jgi:transcriptional regulator with XRE-family HTH domain